jgi:hypothetical protein
VIRAFSAAAEALAAFSIVIGGAVLIGLATLI